MLQFKLKIDHNMNQHSGQRKHIIECNGEVAGYIYDNRNCESQKTNFVFFPYASRVAGEFSVGIGSDDRDYLLHAKDIRGDELAEVLDMVRGWGEAVEKRVNDMRDDFRKVLDLIPDRPFTKTEQAKEYDGVSAKILKGSEGSFRMDLTWAELAKLYGSSYGECSEYQVTDCGVRGRDWGLKWTYYRNQPTMQAISYSGTRFLSIERSDAHQGEG